MKRPDRALVLQSTIQDVDPKRSTRTADATELS
jgi:hypothetical protein